MPTLKVAAEPLSDDGFQFFESRIARCANDHHPNCPQNHGEILLKRVLDISTSDSDSIRLCGTLPNQRDKYVALSHRWGQDQEAHDDDLGAGAT